MKRNFFSAIIVLSLFGCKDNGEKQSQDSGKKPDMITMESKAAKRDFSQVKFAMDKDTICGMPLSAGISDTANVDGKIYGFCSPECKEAFLTEAGHKH